MRTPVFLGPRGAGRYVSRMGLRLSHKLHSPMMAPTVTTCRYLLLGAPRDSGVVTSAAGPRIDLLVSGLEDLTPPAVI